MVKIIIHCEKRKQLNFILKKGANEFHLQQNTFIIFMLNMHKMTFRDVKYLNAICLYFSVI